MTYNNVRYTVTILLLVLILATIVHAHPYGSNNFDDMDYIYLTNLGSHFEALGHHQFAQMATSPMAGSSRASASPHTESQPRQPRSHPAPTSAPNSSQYTSPWGPEFARVDTQLDSRHAQQTQQFHQSPAQATSHPMYSSTPPYASAPPAPTQTAFLDGYQQPDPLHRPTLLQQAPQQMDQSLMQFFPELDHASHQNTSIPVFQHIPESARAISDIPRILPSGITENPNYHPGMVDRAVGNMLGWVRRAPTIGDRSMPALTVDTNFLAPPDASPLHPSPSSASSAGSSGRSPSRRSGSQMYIGDLRCHHCDAAFNTQGDLTHHLRSHQPYSNRNHVCPQCNKRFQYRKDLARHAPQHDPNRTKFYCTYTGCKYHTKGFGRQDHLDRHMSTQHNRVDSPQASRSPSNYA